MAQYLLSVCYAAGAVPPAPDELERIIADVQVVDADMRSSGVWVFSGGLHDAATATVVTSRQGDVALTDGPFVESKEQIGGFSIIDVDNLDAALDWAARLSEATTTPVEVRPFQG